MKRFIFSKKNQRCKIYVKWLGNGRGRLRPVQNDRTGFPEVLEWVLTNKSLKKTMKNMFFHDFPVEKSFKIFQKNCLNFSDPMFKILQNPQKSGGRKNTKSGGDQVRPRGGSPGGSDRYQA